MPAPTRRRVRLVNHCRSAPLAKSRLWAFDVRALADLGRCSVRTVRRDVASGKLDPVDLWSVVGWANGKAT